ncbi:MAG TPA: thiamine phosphate synthase [Allosphingosinicella sp.]|nr:thiamine phosphate synthase [Allosphingosinicella sp.]
MDARHPLPRLWLMTDERLGDALMAAVDGLPEGAGIVFRHYRTEPHLRRALFDDARARRGDLLVLLAGTAEEAQEWGADGSHGRGPGAGLRTAPVHDPAELREAEEAGAAAVFVSPVFTTRSHPGAAVLGTNGFEALAAEARVPAIALGGMNAERFALLRGAYGWAAIDAWLEA